MEEGSTLAKQVIAGYDALQSARSTFDGTLDDVTFYVLPEYENQNARTRTEDGSPDRPSSSAPTDAAILLGGHLFSHTVSTGEQWFTLRTTGDNDNEDRELKEWLDDATKTALKAIQNSNFNEAYGEMCTLLGTYGTGVLSTDFDDSRRELIFRNHSINGNVYLVEDSRGRINGLYRCIRMTGQQAVERFGESNVTDEVKLAADDPSKATEKFDFIQHVGVNPKYKVDSVRGDAMKYRSVHVQRNKEAISEEKGFRTFPFACPRFIKIRDFAYGYGSGHMALPSIRELNKAEADYMDAYERAAFPVTWVPDEEAVEAAENVPNAVNYWDASSGQKPFVATSQGDPAALFNRIQQLEQRVNRQFFIDVFLAVSARYGGDKTAREVEEISEEKLSSISPMVSRLQSECFTSLIERVVDVLVFKGIIPSPPESLAGKDFRVVYTSRIDSKMAAIEVNSMLRSFGEAHQLIMMDAETEGRMRRSVDIDKSVAGILERRNIDMDLIVPERKRKEMDDAAAKAAQQQQQQQAALELAKSTDLGKKPEEGSPAESMV